MAHQFPAYYDAPEAVRHDNLPEVSYGEGLETAQPGKEVVAPAVVEYYAKGYEGHEGREVGAQPLRKQRICGLGRTTFWICFGVGILVIIAAVGGGVGGALAANKSNSSTSNSAAQTTGSAIPLSVTTISSASPSSSSSPSSTTTTTTTTSAAPEPTDIAGCPTVNNTIFLAPSGAHFQKICWYDILGTSIDIKMVTVSTFDSCIGLCDSYNTEHGKGKCKSVVWDIIGSQYQQCWMKNATTALAQNGIVGRANGTAAAILQS